MWFIVQREDRRGASAVTDSHLRTLSQSWTIGRAEGFFRKHNSKVLQVRTTATSATSTLFILLCFAKDMLRGHCHVIVTLKWWLLVSLDNAWAYAQREISVSQKISLGCEDHYRCYTMGQSRVCLPWLCFAPLALEVIVPESLRSLTEAVFAAHSTWTGIPYSHPKVMGLVACLVRVLLKWRQPELGFSRL